VLLRQCVRFSEDGVTLDNIWIEHGHRWENITAVVGSPTVGRERVELRLPPGAVFSRYLVNILERDSEGSSGVLSRITSRICGALHTMGDTLLAYSCSSQVSGGARKVLTLAHATADSLAETTRYAVMGHTHVQEVRELPSAGGTAVYVNTGTWNPRRVPALRRSAAAPHYRFVRFLRDDDSRYSLSSLVWNDADGIPLPASELAAC
jgi:hypothetical protein